MKKYSIKDIELLTGIKAHTLRMWEQRYQFLIPHRSDTNMRFYDQTQLKTLLNVSLLVHNGIRISQVTSMSDEEINSKVKDAFEEKLGGKSAESVELAISGLILAMIEMDEPRFNRVFDRALAEFSMEDVLTNIVEPFLKRAQVMWRTGEVSGAVDHFIQSLIRHKVIVGMDQLNSAESNNEKYLVFLPETEYNDLHILLYMYMLKLKKRVVVNLGQDIPIQELLEVVRVTQPDVMLTFFGAPYSPDFVESYMNRLADTFPHKRILFAGQGEGGHGMKLKRNTGMIQSLEEFSDMLDNS